MAIMEGGRKMKLIKQVRINEEEFEFIEFLRNWDLKPHELCKAIKKYIKQEDAVKQLDNFIKKYEVFSLDKGEENPGE